MKSKLIFSIVALLLCFSGLFSCSKHFLNYTPNGTVTAADLTSPTAVEALVIAAYASLGNEDRKSVV